MSRPVVVGSVVLHGLVVVFLIGVVRPAVVKARLPGDTRGERLTLTFDPGRAAAHAGVKVAKAAPVAAAPVKSAVASLRPTASAASSPAASAPNANQGADSLGDGNVTVALATFFPRPQPDLSMLSAGTQGDEILEVVIDAQGRIAQATVAQSLGASVDQTVLATVQTWQFQPATKDGVAVASEQELLFHYARG